MCHFQRSLFRQFYSPSALDFDFFKDDYLQCQEFLLGGTRVIFGCGVLYCRVHSITERASTASLGGINSLPPCQNTSTMVY